MTYSLGSLWAPTISPWLVYTLPLYLSAFVWLVRNYKRHPASVRTFLACTVTLLLAMIFLNGFKAHNYLSYVVPFYDAILAAWIVSLWHRGPDARAMAVVLAAGFAFFQLSTSVKNIREDEYHRDYEPTIQALQNYRAAGKTILATSSVGFGLEFSGFADDWRLGRYSGIKPDILVVDRNYRDIMTLFEVEEPSVFSHVVETLSSTYRFAGRNGIYWIFERLPDRDGKPTPWIDVSAVSRQPLYAKAKYFFVTMGNITEAAARASSGAANAGRQAR
jgi:hypothetical protein